MFNNLRISDAIYHFWALELLLISFTPHKFAVWHGIINDYTNLSKRHWGVESIVWGISPYIQSDSFGTRPKKMRISQRLFIRFWTCIYDYTPCSMRSMSILGDAGNVLHHCPGRAECDASCLRKWPARRPH